jgi:hypothetical protein
MLCLLTLANLYLQLVCSRANFHFNQDLRYDDASSATSGETSFNLQLWKDGFQPLHKGLKKSMLLVFRYLVYFYGLGGAISESALLGAVSRYKVPP